MFNRIGTIGLIGMGCVIVAVIIMAIVQWSAIACGTTCVTP
ncbi:hypothetical protein GGE17_003555 [Rhizobium leguminosarum]|nr:hypothetical protein [Rhizobium leguminosarum]MBB4342131.1 hypothetical protein [Rhizobium leguminosarum]